MSTTPSSRAKVLAVALSATVAFVLVAAPAAADEIAITVAPNVLNLQNAGQVVTVHTDIPYWSVDVSTVYLNGIAISSWKADDQGNFVAKFLMEEVKRLDGLVIGGYNTLKIVGLTKDEHPFWGQAEIKVIDVAAKGR